MNKSAFQRFLPLVSAFILLFISNASHADSALWVAESQGVLKVALESGEVLFEIPKSGDVDGIAVDVDSGRVWALGIHKRQQRRLKAFNAEGVVEVDVAVPQIHKKAEPADMVADSEGVWVAVGHELFRFNKQGQLQKSIRFRRPINSLTLDTERLNLWVSVAGNIFILDSNGDELDRWRTFFPFDMQLDYDRSLDACWLTLGPFLLRLNAENRDLEFVSKFGVGFKLRRHLSADGQGGVWGATATQLSHVNTSGEIEYTLKPFRHDRGPHQIQDMVADPEDGSAWIASRTTLKQYSIAGIDQKELALDRINRLALSVQIPPKLEIASPEQNSFINTNTPTIELQYSSNGEIDTGSIQITQNNLVLAADCIASQTEANCTPVFPLLEGEVTLEATVADTNGNVSKPAQVTFTVDTLAPEITVTNPSDGLITNQSQLIISGTVNESLQALTLDHDGDLVGLQADNNNAFNHTIALNEGGNTLTITAVDAAGNLGSVVLNVTLDTVVPAAPDIGLITIGSPGLGGLVNVSGQSGSVESGSQVVITKLTTGESVTATAGSNGAFSADIAAQAGDAIQITTTDAAGNASESVQGEVQEGDESDATKGELTLLANPPLVFINAMKDVRFSVNVLKGTDDIVEDVRLVQTDAEGNVLADIGEMADDGQNGDGRAGDWNYSIKLMFNESAPVTRYYRAIVNLQNDDRQILSQVRKFRVTEAPYAKAPDEDKLVHDLGYSFPINQIIVRLPENETKVTAQALADSVAGSIIGFTPILNLYLLEVPVTTIEELNAMIDWLDADSRTIHAKKNLLIEFEVVNDMTLLREADADKSRPFERIKAFQAWDMINANLDSLKLSPVHVGIWDSGVNINHPEFAGVKFGYLSTDHDHGSPSRGTCGGVDSHGTGVAGIIGASSSLSAPGIEMNGILGGAVDDSGKPLIPYTLSVAHFRTELESEKEIDAMIAAGAQVINYSAGMTLKDALSGTARRCSGADPEEFEKYVNDWEDLVKSHEHDVIFVASAGNNDIKVAQHAPAGSIHADNLISVAATNAADQKSDFSNHGASIDIAAPGGGSSSSDRVYVPTQYSEPLSSNDYDDVRGTSYSAPLVTGAVALIKSFDKDGKLTPKQIKQLIRDTADPIETSIGGKRLNLLDLTRCGVEEEFAWHYAGVGYGNDGVEPSGGFATESKFRVPFGADHGPDGSLYVIDRWPRDPFFPDETAYRLRKIDPNGMVHHVAGAPRMGLSGDGGPAINARFQGLTDVAVGRDGAIYLADQGNSRIRKIDPQGIIDTLFISLEGGPSAGRYITGVAVADDDTVYFTHQDPDGVYRVTKDGKVTQIATGLSIPYGLDVGPDSSVYVADTYNSRILKISPKGEFSTIGSGQLSIPHDVDVDYQGNLYVADTWNNSVKKITPNGTVSVIISKFESPASISVSKKDCGVVVVSDFGELLHRYD